MLSTAVSTTPASPFGNFSVLAKLARGDMGDLFLARRKAVGGFEKLVVIKRIHAKFMEDRELVNLFFDEARVAARIDHPNVRQVYEIGQEGEHYFMALEYLEGVSLVELLLGRRRDARLKDPRLICSLAAQVCEGLHAAHGHRNSQGDTVVHGELNPRSIFVTAAGYAKILDFDIVEMRGALAERHGFVRRTCAYMSPEQVREGIIDHRSDVFSLGVVCWEAITGRRLFKQKTKKLTLKAIDQGRIPRPSTFEPSISRDLDDTIVRALARDPALRFPSARDFGMALEKAILNSGPPLTPLAVATLVQGAFSEKLLSQREFVQDARRERDALSAAAAMPVPPPAQASDTWEGDDTNAETRVAPDMMKASLGDSVDVEAHVGAAVGDPFSQAESDFDLRKKQEKAFSWQEESSLIRPTMPAREFGDDSDEEDDYGFPNSDTGSAVMVEASDSWPHDDNSQMMVQSLDGDLSKHAIVIPEALRSTAAPSSSSMNAALWAHSEAADDSHRKRGRLLLLGLPILAAGVVVLWIALAGGDDQASAEASEPTMTAGVAGAADRAEVTPEASETVAEGATEDPYRVDPKLADDAEHKDQTEAETATGSTDGDAPEKSEEEADSAEAEPPPESSEPEAAESAAPTEKADIPSRTKRARPRRTSPPKKRSRNTTQRKTRAVATTDASGSGFLTVNAKPYATVYVDGKKHGYTPLVKLKLPAGAHRVKLVSSEGGAPKSFKVQVKADQVVRRTVTW